MEHRVSNFLQQIFMSISEQNSIRHKKIKIHWYFVLFYEIPVIVLCACLFVSPIYLIIISILVPNLIIGTLIMSVFIELCFWGCYNFLLKQHLYNITIGIYIIPRIRFSKTKIFYLSDTGFLYIRSMDDICSIWFPYFYLKDHLTDDIPVVLRNHSGTLTLFFNGGLRVDIPSCIKEFTSLNSYFFRYALDEKIPIIGTSTMSLSTTFEQERCNCP
jgi:hypothetical protein